MPSQKGPIWDHFLSGEKQNGSHTHAHWHGCIEKERPDGDTVELDDEGKPKLLAQSWVIKGNFHSLGAQGISNVNNIFYLWKSMQKKHWQHAWG